MRKRKRLREGVFRCPGGVKKSLPSHIHTAESFFACRFKFLLPLPLRKRFLLHLEALILFPLFFFRGMKPLSRHVVSGLSHCSARLDCGLSLEIFSGLCHVGDLGSGRTDPRRYSQGTPQWKELFSLNSHWTWTGWSFWKLEHHWTHSHFFWLQVKHVWLNLILRKSIM